MFTALLDGKAASSLKFGEDAVALHPSDGRDPRFSAFCGRLPAPR